MLYLHETWANAGFAALVATALLLSLVVPSAGAYASLRFIKTRQPVTAWLIFYLITAVITLVLGTRLLG